MTPRQLLAQASATLARAGCASPKLDAEILLCHVLGRPRSWLIAHADDVLEEAATSSFNALLARREKREPVAYITGEKEWWSRPFRVTPDVLIPRPETEHLIEAVLGRFPDSQSALRLCDIGTGSGCIAITLACEYPNAEVFATDISPAALAVAGDNARRLGVIDRMHFLQGDMLDALPDDACFDVIVSNPPYVGDDEIPGLEPELDHEPRNALTDEADGLRFLTQLVEHGDKHLSEGGLLVVETGVCGLPEGGGTLHLHERIIDLAGHLRGGVFSR